jgi:hypothetical protein
MTGERGCEKGNNMTERLLSEAADEMTEAARRRMLMVRWFRAQGATALNDVAEDIFQRSCGLAAVGDSPWRLDAGNAAWTFDASCWYPPDGYPEVVTRHISAVAAEAHTVEHTRALLDELRELALRADANHGPDE